MRGLLLSPRAAIAAVAMAVAAAAVALACSALKPADDEPPTADAGDAGGRADGADAGGAPARCPAIVELALPDHAPAAAGAWPSSIVVGPDGNVWFTLQYPVGFPCSGASVYGNALGRMAPDGAVLELTAGASPWGPYAMTAGAGDLWFTALASGLGHIELAPDAGAPSIVERTLPGGAIPNGIARGSDGALWFTDFNDAVGRIDPGDGGVVELPTPTRPSQPQGIVPGPDGDLYFGEQVGQIGRITPGDGGIVEFSVRRGNSSVTAVAVGSDGNVWFADRGNDAIGRLSLADGAVTEYALSPGAAPHSIAAGPDGQLWFAESAAAGSIATDGGILECPVPSMPIAITAGPSGVWLTECRAIARLQ